MKSAIVLGFLLIATASLTWYELARAQKAEIKANRLAEFCNYQRADFCRVRNALESGSYQKAPDQTIFEACAPGVYNDWKLLHGDGYDLHTEGYNVELLKQVKQAIDMMPNTRDFPDWPDCQRDKQ